MEIKTPRKGGRSNRSSFYHSRVWKELRKKHISGYQVVDGVLLDNKYCIECWKERQKRILMHTVDHIKALNDGGTNELSNLQSLCEHHNAIKTANDGNFRSKNKGQIQGQKDGKRYFWK